MDIYDFNTYIFEYDAVYSDKGIVRVDFLEFYYNLIEKGKDVYIFSDNPDIKSNNLPLVIGDFYKLYYKVLNDMDDISDKLKYIVSFSGNVDSYNRASLFTFTTISVGHTCGHNIIRDYYDIVTPINANINCLPVYISSKTHHKDKWKLLKETINIKSSWIDVDTPKEEMTVIEKEQLCRGFLTDITNSDFLVFYAERVDSGFFGVLIEIGMASALSKDIYVIGDNKFESEIFSHLPGVLNFKYVNNYDVNKTIFYIYIERSCEYISKCIEIKDMLNTYNSGLKLDNIYRPLDYVAIVACGGGTRLLPVTKYIPKLLVCIDNDSILSKIVTYWKEYTKKFIIIVQQKHNILVKYYLDFLNVEYEIINVEIPEKYENSFTISKALSGTKYVNSKMLLTWCDIYPNSKIPSEVFLDGNIIFTYKTYGRYDAFENKIIKKSFGNVIGIYYFGRFQPLTIFENTMDICDCYIDNFKTFNTYEISDLTDVGDIVKLNKILSNNKKYKTRYFNEITPNTDNSLTKKSTCKYGNGIINDEMRFYKFHSCYRFSYLPRVISYLANEFTMENLKGITLYNYFTSQPYKTQLFLVDKTLTLLKDLHAIKIQKIDSNKLDTDLKIEFSSKVNLRLKNIAPILREFQYIKYVNGVFIDSNIEFIKKELYTKIFDHFIATTSEYNTLHGDPHMSNIIFKDNELYLIDPRGYFGNTKIFGLMEYDIGKIIYSLSGFDEFNSDSKFIFHIENNEDIRIDINDSIPNFIHLFKEYNVDILIYMTILHWFGLADYMKTNIHKCVSSYYYGIYLYHRYCKK